MKLFFRLFHTGIPWDVLFITLLPAIVLSFILLRNSKTQQSRNILLLWIVVCLFLMLYSTVLGREQNDCMSFCFVPFYSIEKIQKGLIEVMYEKIYNVIFFIPLGLLLGFVFKRKVFLHVFFAGFFTSFSIEFLQLITRTGTCETDDVICNTIGCAIGVILFITGKKLFKYFKRHE